MVNEVNPRIINLFPEEQMSSQDCLFTGFDRKVNALIIRAPGFGTALVGKNDRCRISAVLAAVRC